MRTELSTARASAAAVSLTDFTRAVRNADAAEPHKAHAAVGVAADLVPVIPEALMMAALKTLDEALQGRHPTDPLLGVSLSRLVSIINAAVKRSGPLIEQALDVALERAGFVVFRQVGMPVSRAAKNLVAFNDMRSLRGVSVASDAPADGPMIVYDLLVYCPKSRRAVLIEVKRGSGKTEVRKIKPISAALKAGSLQIKTHLRRLGIKAHHVDAKLVDYYGRSGFDDEIRITGAELDRYFGASVQGLIEAVLGEIRRRLFAALPNLLAQAMAEAAQGPEPERQPRMITIGDGIRIAPEHISSIELPMRRAPRTKLRPKTAGSKVITIRTSRRPSGSSAATL
jgi:hypothetical protein